ncbi:MAG: hypothetical protein ACYDBV_11195 [Nitrospiria bacterium]
MEEVAAEHKKEFDSTVTNRLPIATWVVIIGLWITLTGFFVKAIWGIGDLNNQVNLTTQKVNIDSARIDKLEKSTIDGRASDDEIKYNLKALLNHFHIQYIQNDDGTKQN